VRSLGAPIAVPMREDDEFADFQNQVFRNVQTNFEIFDAFLQNEVQVDEAGNITQYFARWHAALRKDKLTTVVTDIHVSGGEIVRTTPSNVEACLVNTGGSRFIGSEAKYARPTVAYAAAILGVASDLMWECGSLKSSVGPQDTLRLI
jgi:hypothetical protein